MPWARTGSFDYRASAHHRTTSSQVHAKVGRTLSVQSMVTQVAFEIDLAELRLRLSSSKIYLHTRGTKVVLYTWLPESHHDYLRDDRGRQVLSNWLSNLGVDPLDVIKEFESARPIGGCSSFA